MEKNYVETREWLDSLAAVVHFADIDRAGFLLDTLAEALYRTGYTRVVGLNTSYQNSLPAHYDAAMPEDDVLAEKVSSLIRWNAAAMVLKAGKFASELGGHISTYASVATLYEVGFDYFFKAATATEPGDCVYFQGHSIPGIYARAFLEGRFEEENLLRFRQEVSGGGLSSYPHPWLMPDFWQFPTVSMGLGPLSAIYQARYLKYLQNRELQQNSSRQVWAFCGDGEMDEPESVGALSIAARENLDNLIFVVNCNLQRLDGPVRGNGKIVQELEAIFHGARWRVIKVLWNSAWDKIFSLDTSAVFRHKLANILDGDLQRFANADIAARREMLFADDKELTHISKNISDQEIAALNFGGHDRRKIFAAYKEAVSHQGQPVVILAHSVKGYGLGSATAGMNIAHNQKKLSENALLQLRDTLSLDLSDEQVLDLSFYRPKQNDDRIEYLKSKRAMLGGVFPTRRQQSTAVIAPKLSAFKPLLAASGDREISTTMAFVRVLSLLLRDSNLKEKIVPIVPDESRTFGMEGLFRQIGIYAADGQHYNPVDKGQIMYYREAKDGQLLEEGINEAGAFASWLAAATSYSNNNLVTIPFYIYYSMFGFQRIGDLAWAAGDARARGFLLGATAGRTTLAGEGLQHNDGQSHVYASTIPNCISYDPAFGYEVAAIIQHGIERMYVANDDVYYYITLANENYIHPAMPINAIDGIIKGMYKLNSYGDVDKHAVLLGCGSILLEVIAAAEMLFTDYSISVDVWSVTSFTELKRDAERVAHKNIHDINATASASYVAESLAYHSGPVIAATDYIRTFAEQIRPHIPHDYHVLGTDGYGRSDTRMKLRQHFAVNAKYIAYMTVYALVQEGAFGREVLQDAHKRYAIEAHKKYSLDC